MKYFDAHAHLQLREFDGDREAVIARMKESETGAIMVGVDMETSRQAFHLANSNERLWAAVGLHPTDNLTEVYDTIGFSALAEQEKVVAIGECGLDYSRAPTDRDKHAQLERFAPQIALAAELQKPLIIHCRASAAQGASGTDAHEDMISVLTEAKKQYGDALSVVIHFCTVSGEIARRYADLGCYLSFPGPITYTDMYDDSIRVVTVDRILSETDSPFAAPVPYRGTRNEPVYVRQVVEKIAAVRGMKAEAVRTQILENAQRVFRLPEGL